MTDKTVCFTGHRKIPDNQLKRIAVRLDKTVERLIKYYIYPKNTPKGVCSGATAVWWIAAVCAWHI